MAYIDMTGWRMSEHGVPDSRWEVLEKIDIKANGQICWLCRCSCEKHTEKILPGGELRRGKTKSCGCFRSEFSSKKQSIDLIGQKFGELIVTEKTNRQASDGTYYWKCKCSCGNANYTISTTELRRTGKRAKKHCNNTIHLIKDLTGQQIGYLKIIKLDETSLRQNGNVRWFCKCTRCNRKDLVLVKGNSLISGKTRSCGCGCSFSMGAEKTLNILKENQLNIKPEYSFADLKNPKTNTLLRFDFGVCDDNNKILYLIEYDGEQHFYYQENATSWNTKETFEGVKYRDSIKNQYCLNNGIPLYRIPYYDIDKISTLQDILQDKYLVKPT